MEQHPVIRTQGISKWFMKPEPFQALKSVSFTMSTGEFVSVMGKSGCGKSTLLYILSTMDTDYEGSLYIGDKLVTGMKPDALASLRAEKIGFVFQFHYLLPEFTVLENVMIPALKLNKFSKEEIEQQAYERLEKLEIADQARKRAANLSGGQKQRVAIARALVNNPMIIMGDEPTGNLDSRNANVVFDILRELCDHQNQTILVVTHDEDFAAKTDRRIYMQDGNMLP